MVRGTVGAVVRRTAVVGAAVVGAGAGAEVVGAAVVGGAVLGTAVLGAAVLGGSAVVGAEMGGSVVALVVALSAGGATAPSLVLLGPAATPVTPMRSSAEITKETAWCPTGHLRKRAHILRRQPLAGEALR